MMRQKKERVTAHFRGMVQGVGFRYTTVILAKDFDVTGYIKNLRDGRVELVAEGDRQELTRFLETVQGEFSHSIRDVHIEWDPASGAFDEFRIGY